MVIFRPYIRTIDTGWDRTRSWSEEELLSEQGFYASDLSTILNHGGPISREVVESIPREWIESVERSGLEPNIDIRVHHMLVGDFPATPGWHVDSASRETEFSAHSETTDVEKTMLLTVSSHIHGVSNTTLCIDDIECPGTYQEATENGNENLGLLMRNRNCATQKTVDNVWTMIDEFTIHQASPAHNDGVRLFVRLSAWNRPHGVTPGISRCEQVYRMVE